MKETGGRRVPIGMRGVVGAIRFSALSSNRVSEARGMVAPVRQVRISLCPVEERRLVGERRLAGGGHLVWVCRRLHLVDLGYSRKEEEVCKAAFL